MKKTFAFFTVAILNFSCNENSELPVESTNSQNENSESDNTGKQEYDARLIYKSENVKVFGDGKVKKDVITEVMVKFEPYIGFEDFKVKTVDHIKSVDMDLNSNQRGKTFRTRLREGYENPQANFAGHYTFVEWGCGTTCYQSMIIDRKTGKIYDGPSASLSYEFRADSRMIIVNPPENGFYQDISYYKPLIFVFDEEKKTFQERKTRK
ncbi:MAG: hypothetical protein ACKOQ6_07465 [Bacteroidota bacterium]